MIQEIGRGATSAVFAAWRDGDDRRLVAVKVLWPANDEHRSRFEREITILKRLEGPGIVKCSHSAVSGGILFYEMELVRGKPLDVYLREDTPSLQQKLAVLERVCRVVSSAHEQGVAHRDLKPSNVLVDRHGLPHLLDFGLGAIQSAEWNEIPIRTRTKPGHVMGTVMYMSPEQAWGGLLGGPIDHRSDIWALGITLYRIATNGAYPYDARPMPDRSAEEALLYRIRTEMPKSPRLDGSTLSQSLVKLIDRTLVWEKEYRIQSARELADDIRRCINEGTVRTRPLSTAYRVQRLFTSMAVRQRGLLWAASVAATLMLVSLFLFVGNVHWREIGVASNRAFSFQGQVGMNTPQDVAIVGIEDDSVLGVLEYAKASEIEGVTSNLRTWRRLHGQLMRRLVDCRPRAVVWDFYFPTSQPNDDIFAEGVNALQEAGIPVVLGVAQWDKNNGPALSQSILRDLEQHVHWGALLGRNMVQRPGEFVMTLRRGDVTIPAISLVTVAALAHPARKLVVEWPERSTRLTLLYQEPNRPDSVLPRRDLVELSKSYTILQNEYGASPGDELGCKTLGLHHPAVWEKRVISYDRALAASDETLRAWFGDRLVLLGDLRDSSPSGGHDRHAVRYGSMIEDNVPGCYLIADAIIGLSTEPYLRSAFPMNAFVLLVGTLVGILGCAFPGFAPVARLISKPEHCALLVLGLGLLCAFGTLFLLDDRPKLSAYLGIWILVGACSALVSTQIERARIRYRVI